MIHHTYADVNGIRMHYASAGQGTPILFLHGFPEYWGVWRRILQELSPHFRCIAPDLRGYNLTSKPEGVEAYRIEHLVGDVVALLDHLGLPKVRLVAQDWGAFVGWCFLLRHPERVERFVTINLTHPRLFDEALRNDPAQQAASQYMLSLRSPGAEATMEENDFAALRQAVFEEARARGAEVTGEDIEAWVEAWRQPGALIGGLNYYRAAEVGPPDGQGRPGGSNVLERLGIGPDRLRVEVPVLVISGEEDRALLQSGLDRLHSLVTDLRIRKIPGASHWVTLQRPALVAALIREHCRVET
jgi:epoxide hydrolase 4